MTEQKNDATVIQQDWENRDFIESVQYSILKIVNFLNKFDISTRYKLAKVNEKLTQLDRQLGFLEASLENCEPSRVEFVEAKQPAQLQPQRAPPISPIPGAGTPLRSGPPVLPPGTGKPPPGPGAKPPPGPGAKPPPGPGAKPPAGPGAKPPPGQGAKPPPGPGTKPHPGPGAKPHPGPGAKPPPVINGGPPSKSAKRPGGPPGGAPPGGRPPGGPPSGTPPGSGPPRGPPGGSTPNGTPSRGPAPGRGPPPGGPPPGGRPPGNGPPPSSRGPPSGRGPPGRGPRGSGSPPGSKPPVPSSKPPIPSSKPPVPAEAPPHPGKKEKRKKKKERKKKSHKSIQTLGPNKEITLETSKAGDGKTFPGPNSQIFIHYTGYLADGTQFDASQGDYEIVLGSGMNIVGLEEALKAMSVGQEAVAKIPSHLAYGPQGAGDLIPPNCDLSFQLKLVGVNS